ncbi:serine/threonine-protein kinase [Streptomyces sp. gb1(2016)]|uniref:Serine/threonine protein kinase n=1 Tax=Streptomyces sp. gb1(2016) TaxID=1828321 RepID=A0A652KTH7_9ACTN|nr:serine/threonine-protein kinase [Streptomyces sp. gb1(2016)]TXS27032.1 serine/threonine protein kinase [Streptomyces sp. gb1(2016)]
MNRARDAFEPLQADDPAVVAGYRLAARLGAGGMGRVYLSHTQGGRPVAIKVVRPELADDPDFRRRFGREIKAARQVRGAYTAELIDADADGTPPWLATLYVPGPSLTEAVTRRGPLPVPAVLWLMAGVAEALKAIHAEGIVHRDLKPSNVLLAADGPRVIDFGIALAADGTAYTATGGTIGTPSFMAPEQAAGDEVTAAADVFALAQTAAYAALGKPLYGDGPAVNVLYRIVHSEPDLSLLPQALRPLFARCLAAGPAERATPEEIVEWCRHRLGAEAEAGGGPAVWREFTGPETVVPAPVPEPTPAYPQPPVPAAVSGPPSLSASTSQLTSAPVPVPAPGFPQPPAGRPQLTQEQRRGRRRRTALITAAGVTGGALLVVALAWSLMDAMDRLDDRDKAGSRTSATGPAGQPSASAPGSAPGSSSGSSSGASDASDPSGASDSAGSSAAGARDGAAEDVAAPPADPRPEGFPLVWMDAKNSLSLTGTEPSQENRKGDVRFGCGSAGCELKGGHTVFVQIFGGHGTTLDECRLMLDSATKHEWPLAGAAAGTEICMKDDKGNIGLYVIQTKSTALPDLAFLQGDLTVWRNADR